MTPLSGGQRCDPCRGRLLSRSVKAFLELAARVMDEVPEGGTDG
ncbi:hypothetical protein [Streptomyces cyaneofuscatus]|nr:hypothetical protein [Streptomyces cyaneofuscatus]